MVLEIHVNAAGGIREEGPEVQGVDVAAAVDQVASVPPVDPVVAVARQDRVVAAIAPDAIPAGTRHDVVLSPAAADGGGDIGQGHQPVAMRNVYVECLEGTHFHFGHENGHMADGTTPSPAFIRESTFYDLESRGGGNLRTGADAVVIDSHGIGDASNLSNFFNLKVVYPYRNGLRMVNHSTTNAIRRLNFYNLLVHGPGRTGVPSAAPLVVLHGAIFWCNFFGLQINSTNAGQTGLETDSLGGQAPKGLRFLADISSGEGDSFDFRAGGQFLLSSAAFGARGTDVTLGPGVNDTVAIETLGAAPALSVHSGSARHLRHLTGSGEARPLVVGALAPGDGRSGPRLLQGEEDPRDGLEAPEGSLYLRRAGREGGARTGDRAFLNRGSDTTPAWAPVAVALGGPAEERPADPVPYQSYVDTTLGKTIWWHGEGWRDADGNPA